METRSIIEDDGNMQWQQLLKVFKKIIDGNPPAEKVREALEKLKETASSSKVLTYRQVDGIIARCDNYLKGEYGNTKTEANLAYGKPSLNGIK